LVVAKITAAVKVNVSTIFPKKRVKIPPCNNNNCNPPNTSKTN